MVVIWGSGMYGKTDEVPQMWHVATRFGHLYYLPLIPLGSFALLAGNPDDSFGVPIPLSGKSILIAWLRTVFVLGAIVAGILAVAGFSKGDHAAGAALTFLTIVCVGLFIASKRVGWCQRASYERAVQVAELVGASNEGRLMIEIIYGRMNAEQAAAELARRTADQSELTTLS